MRRAGQIVFAILAVALLRAEIVDRISIVVSSRAIKHSDILSDIRLTAFLNQEKPDYSLAEQKKAASRLIDQALIRRDMENGGYAGPDTSEAEKLLAQIKQRYRGDAALRQALASYGITEEELRQRLIWQTRVLQFIELRFGEADPNNQVNQQFFAWLDETRKQSRILYKEENLK